MNYTKVKEMKQSKPEDKWEKSFNEFWDLISEEPEFSRYNKEPIKDFIRNLLKQRDEDLKKELIKKLHEMRYRKTEYGYKRKGEIGTATNSTYCEASNDTLSEVKKIIENELK